MRILIISDIDLLTEKEENNLYFILNKANIEYRVFDKDIDKSTVED